MTSKRNRRRKPSRRRTSSRRTSRRRISKRRTSRALAGLLTFGNSAKKVQESLNELSVKVNGSKKPRTESDIKTWKCILCGDIGHTWRDCPKNADKKILKTIRNKENMTVKDKDGNKLQRLRYEDEFFNTNIKPHLPDNFVPPRKKTRRKRKSAKRKSVKVS